MSENVFEKITAVGCLFLITVLCSFIPYKLRKFLKNNKKITGKTYTIFISCSLFFGAGVLLATVFLHMLKETQEHLTNLSDIGYISTGDYPLAELILCCGFFIIYIFEEAVVNYALKGSNPFEQQSSDTVTTEKIEKPKKNYCLDSHEPTVATDDGECPEHCEDPNIELTSKKNFLRSLLLMTALYMHTFFAGLAIGVAASADEIWLLLIAFTSHKVFIVFSISLELLELNLTRSTYCVFSFIFGFMPCVGCACGILLTEYLNDNKAEELAVAILTGISGGTILFVIFCEIVERERLKPYGRLQKLISFIFGFMVMALLILIPEERGHGDQESIPISVS